ncbi:hypothetical protein B296_00012128 [Ensete ventricosum]|uniref:Uncharacterized protein n=1 Tax=Ensete ventricosum TaxID=4639 RepID=A0A427ACH6_ENSVE|nr:hypothetical protein B296_00012128 [Ensete ventricosum]
MKKRFWSFFTLAFSLLGVGGLGTKLGDANCLPMQDDAHFLPASPLVMGKESLSGVDFSSRPTCGRGPTYDAHISSSVGSRQNILLPSSSMMLACRKATWIGPVTFYYFFHDARME